MSHAGDLNTTDENRALIAETLRQHQTAYESTGHFSDTLRAAVAEHLADEVEGGETTFSERDFTAMLAAFKYRLAVSKRAGGTHAERTALHFAHADVQDAAPPLTGDPLR